MRCITPCILLLLLPLAASAAPTVLYGPELDAVSAAARAASYLDAGDFRVAGPAADLVVGADAELVAQGLSLQRCVGEAGELSPVLGVARIQVLEMEFASARAALEGAAAALPCGARDATREQMFELFFLQGLAAFNGGNEAAAKAGFAAAAAVSSSQPWPPSYPPTAKVLFLEALQAALSSKATVVDTDLTDLWVDGEVAENLRGVPLLAGQHVLRWGDDVVLATASPEGGVARVTTAGTLRSWLETGAEPAGPWLAGFAQANNWDRVLLLIGEQVYELVGEQLMVQEPVVSEAKLPQPAAAGLAMLGIGAGTFGVGLSANLGAWEAGRSLVRSVEPATVTPAHENSYTELRAINGVGLGLTLGGGVLAGTGAVIAAVSLLAPRTTTLSRRGAGIVPVVAASGEGVVLGVAGRF